MTARVLLVVEDDPDIRTLVGLTFAGEADFVVDGEASSAQAALALAAEKAPDLIVLDHLLDGATTGLDIAPRLKEVAPRAKIILFTASEQLRERAKDSRDVDAFLLKTDIHRLLAVARRILGL